MLVSNKHWPTGSLDTIPAGPGAAGRRPGASFEANYAANGTMPLGLRPTNLYINWAKIRTANPL